MKNEVKHFFHKCFRCQLSIINYQLSIVALRCVFRDGFDGETDGGDVAVCAVAGGLLAAESCAGIGLANMAAFGCGEMAVADVELGVVRNNNMGPARGRSRRVRGGFIDSRAHQSRDDFLSGLRARIGFSVALVGILSVSTS